MMNHKEIFSKYSHKYDLLMSREDYRGNILPALQKIKMMKGLDIVEMGAGTGIFTQKLLPLCNKVYAYDKHRAMIECARRTLKNTGYRNWEVGIADNRSIPLSDHVADIVIGAWTICYVVSWNWNNWEKELNRCIKEAERLLKPNGIIILLETLGTGNKKPFVPYEPSDKMLKYYEYLKNNLKFHMKWIRTDFKFLNIDEARDLAAFFFGDELSAYVENNHTTILPECTGIWWKKY